MPADPLRPNDVHPPGSRAGDRWDPPPEPAKPPPDDASPRRHYTFKSPDFAAQNLPARAEPTPPAEVHDHLQTNRRAEVAHGLDQLRPLPRRRKWRRTFDYLLLLLLGNAFCLFFGGLFPGVPYAIFYSLAVSWAFLGIMDNY